MPPTCPKLHASDLLGVAQVASLLGIADSTWRAYVARGQAPRPIYYLGAAPAWTREQLEEWQAVKGKG